MSNAILNLQQGLENLGDQALLNNILEMLSDQLERTIPRLQDSNESCETIASLLHQFKGVLPLLCAPSFSNALADAEKDALDQKWTSSHSLIPQLQQLAQEIKELNLK